MYVLVIDLYTAGLAVALTFLLGWWGGLWYAKRVYGQRVRVIHLANLSLAEKLEAARGKK